MISITEDDYEYHTENYDGVCLGCGEWQDGGVEPDAENYKCEACGENKIVGAEQALIMGEIDFEGC